MASVDSSVEGVSKERPNPLWYRSPKVLGLFLVGIVAISTVLSVNMFPVIGNDSVQYILHSNDLTGLGFVNLGYRQVGYPFAIFVARSMAGVLTIEPLMFAAVLQRVLLISAVVLAGFFWRWSSIPFLVFLLAAETLATRTLSLPKASRSRWPRYWRFRRSFCSVC